MNKTLEALWYGNIYPFEQVGRGNAAIKELMQLILRHREELSPTLTDNQNEILEKYYDCNSEMTSLYNRDCFVEGFRLGMRLAVEVLSDSDKADI